MNAESFRMRAEAHKQSITYNVMARLGVADPDAHKWFKYMAKSAIKDIEEKQEDDAMKVAFKMKKKRVEQETLNKLGIVATKLQGNSAWDADLIDADAVVSIDCDTAFMSPAASSMTASPFSSHKNSTITNATADCCAGDYCCVSDRNMVTCTITCGYCNGHCHEKCSTKETDGYKVCDACIKQSF
jgi:hypothetical protein